MYGVFWLVEFFFFLTRNRNSRNFIDKSTSVNSLIYSPDPFLRCTSATYRSLFGTVFKRLESGRFSSA